MMKNISIEDQKSIADSVLEKLKYMDPTAIVAGGAPRDWSFGKLASDIDVFFHFRPDLQTGRIENLLKGLGLDIHRSNDGLSIPEIYKKNPDIRCIYYTNIKGLEVQLILMHNPTYKVVNHFPLNICKVWYKDSKINETIDFKRACKHKAIVKVSNLYSNGDAYVKKIIDKFPAFQYYDSYEKLAESY